MAELTEAEKFVSAQLAAALKEGERFRVGVMLLTYASGTPDADCRIAQAVMLKSPDLASAMDLILMIRALRGLADHLDKLTRGEVKPGPMEPG